MVAASAAGPACGPDTSSGDGDGDGDGAGGSTGGTGTGGTVTTGGTPGDGDGDAAACDNGSNFESYTQVQLSDNCLTENIPNCNITDFTSASYDPISGDWGDDMSLTGETFEYSDEDSTVEWTVEGDAVVVGGTVAGDGYIGFGLSYGPCTDATDFDGIQVTVQGELTEGGIMELQMQEERNYPIGGDNGTENRGSCEFVVDADKWSECANNHFDLEGVSPDEAYTYYIPWSYFVGGNPNTTLDPQQLRGMQFQIGCDVDKAPCAPDVHILDVRFYRDHEEALGPEAMGGAPSE